MYRVLCLIQKEIAGLFLLTLFCNAILPGVAFARHYKGNYYHNKSDFRNLNHSINFFQSQHKFIAPGANLVSVIDTTEIQPSEDIIDGKIKTLEEIDGPSQPEMSSFKSVGVDNMVDLFTGAFSYNIPLLDVGGYPVNLFYTGNVGAEEDASWVGFGWNINPGSITRDVRGLPDDFKGDEFEQHQNIKPNISTGFSVGLSGSELLGFNMKGPFFENLSTNTRIKFDFNNYLGPSVGLSFGASYDVFSAQLTEKSTAGMKAGLNFDLNSREGLAFSPSLSLSSTMYKKENQNQFGLSSSMSYNSRVGIRGINFSSSFTASNVKKMDVKEVNGKEFEVTRRGSIGLLSSNISFAKPAYSPTIRMPTQSLNATGRFEVGLGWAGWKGGPIEVEVYRNKTEIKASNQKQKKPLYGYLYAQNAAGNNDAILDFNRVNDREVLPNTPVISIPQMTYDVFSIQGEGTGGTVRLYRSDMGVVHDGYMATTSKQFGIGGDIDPAGYYGGDVQVGSSTSKIGKWVQDNYITEVNKFKPSGEIPAAYFRNPGESNVVDPEYFNNVGGVDLVRYKMSGDGQTPAIEPILKRFDERSKPYVGASGEVSLLNKPIGTGRVKSTQVISFLTVAEKKLAGLDKSLTVYNFQDPVKDVSGIKSWNTFEMNSLSRNYIKDWHIGQITVTESSGKSHIYGFPVYNISQQEMTFSVIESEVNNSVLTEKVVFNQGETTLSSADNIQNRDGYIQVTKTPAFAHSFLLTGVLSNDYVDVLGDGITDDDLGTAVKFNYGHPNITGNASPVVKHGWRAPFPVSLSGNRSGQGNFVDGLQSEAKDDKSAISYGERESWYLHSIESKTMVAIFTLKTRRDGKGINTANEIELIMGGSLSSDNSKMALDRISLYSKSDIRKNGLAASRPIKTVHFVYEGDNTPVHLSGGIINSNSDKELCKGTPDNASMGGGGKLTLRGIFFTFNGQTKGTQKSKYIFSYATENNLEFAGSAENPNYRQLQTDRWGSYKLQNQNPGQLKNSIYPFSLQNKPTADENASVWMLKRILLPSGGQITVKYESDDYAFVAKKRAASMYQIAGFSNSSSALPSNPLFNANIYEIDNDNNIIEKHFIFIKTPFPVTSINDARQYLKDFTQIYCKLKIKMPKGDEYVDVYAEPELDGSNLPVCGVFNENTLYVKLKNISGKYGALSYAAASFLREQLPGQAYAGYDNTDGTSLKQIGVILQGFGQGIASSLKSPYNYLRGNRRYAQKVSLNESFARLTVVNGVKYGGGYRVKSVRIRDNFTQLTRSGTNGSDGQFTTELGQEYSYKKTELINGSLQVISSGVASYEPAFGRDENPYSEMELVERSLPGGPASFHSISTPVLDAFFNAPVVGYSSVTVKAINSSPGSTLRKPKSGVGSQVTEFFTARDFPPIFRHTFFDNESRKDWESHSKIASFIKKHNIERRALSQGFLVILNDMHGKLKRQLSFAENDINSPINKVEYYYKNTGKGNTGDPVNFVFASEGGNVRTGLMGIDIELTNDSREFSTSGFSFDLQAQVSLFGFPPFNFPIPLVIPTFEENQSVYRAITTLKTVNYHAFVDKVIVTDKGSMVSTENLMYDSETGAVVVTKTNNDFDKPVYSVNFPARWAYSGMGMASHNIDAGFTGVSFLDGKIVSGITAERIKSIFESGDEILIINPGTGSGCDPQMVSSTETRILWAMDKGKNLSSLTNINPDFIFIDANGKPYNRSNVQIRIIRSGRRNLLTENISSTILATYPVVSGKLRFNETSPNIINTSAAEFKEKWQVDSNVIGKKSLELLNCAWLEVDNCDGYLSKNINPYRKGLLGNFKPFRSTVFYNDRKEIDPATATNVAFNGYLESFVPYWNFISTNPVNNNLIPVDLNAANSKWIWNNEVTRFNSNGMELETKDALNRFTAAQFGYNNSLPLAIVQNSMVNESFYEGFEDNGFKQSMNGSEAVNCSQDKFSFSSIESSSIVASDDIGIKAHTGHKLLSVPADKTLTLSLPSNIYTQFPLVFNPATTPPLKLTGPNTFRLMTSESNLSPTVSSQTIGVNWLMLTADVPSTPCFTFRCYFKATVSGVQQFESFVLNNGGGYTLKISKIDEEGSPTEILCFTQAALLDGNIQNETYKTNNVDLCAGIYYLVEMDYSANPAYITPYYWNNGSSVFWSGVRFPYGSVEIYENLFQFPLTCNYTKPIEGSVYMLNPSFGPSMPVVGTTKKMFFSAWVRENCPGSTCTKATYTDGKVEVKVNSNTIMSVTPSGPIIDGWQKVEGIFEIPSSASQLDFTFNKDGSALVYYDDIRIHPYNSNMKSYVYDPINLRLTAELNENNFATIYEYDEEGTLIRTKAETEKGIKTIQESRSHQQRTINTFQ
jgi:hypothetical protein